MSAKEIIAELEKMSVEERREVVKAIQQFPPPHATGKPKRKLSEILLEIAGTAGELPADLSENYEHYLYGTPKHDPQMGSVAKQPNSEL